MRSAVAISGLALGLGLVSQGTAQAAQATAWTNPSHIGQASFNTSSGQLTVWDTYTDNRRVKASVWNITLGGAHVVSAEDANGNNSDPGYAWASGGYRSGDRLQIQVCRQAGATGTPYDCGYAYVTV
ncbi:hypothetical protein ABZ958_37820 [Streptomyces sp. NPDC046237]|uniref:hypothetical protein n=1 Tax=Streptomyces sp. NPDC046237 TaxID=3154914 RepID=UPI0033EC23DC